MNRIQNTIIAGSLLLLTMNAQAGQPPVPTVDGPASLGLMALGLAGGVLLARYMKR